jgi:hypothetical protein
VPGSCGRGQEVGPADPGDRRQEVIQRNLRQRNVLHDINGHSVERDVNPSGGLRHIVGVRVNGGFVHRIDLGRLRCAALGADVVSHILERRQGTAGQEDRCPLMGIGTCHRAADRSGRPVDNGVLVFQQHKHSFSAAAPARRRPPAQRRTIVRTDWPATPN